MTPSTPDESRLPLPAGFLLQIHSAVSVILHTLSIENEIRRGWVAVEPGKDVPMNQINTPRNLTLAL